MRDTAQRLELDVFGSCILTFMVELLSAKRRIRCLTIASAYAFSREIF